MVADRILCPRLAILQFSLSNNELSVLKINTVHYRERERERKSALKSAVDFYFILFYFSFESGKV